MKWLSLLLVIVAPLLGRAVEETWTSFSTVHPTLSHYSPEEIAALAGEWGKKVGSQKQIDSSCVARVLELLQENSPKVFMRHGEQQMSERVKGLKGPEQKIEMMRLPDNLENGLTEASQADWLEAMIVWAYLKEKSCKAFQLQSSPNTRAFCPARLLAGATNSPLCINESLMCVNYPASLSPEELLKLLPEGTLPWNKEKVDQVIGAGTYERITKDMQGLLEAKCPLIALTHTQQLNAIASLTSLPVTRIGNFGFIVVTAKHQELFSEGFFAKKP